MPLFVIRKGSACLTYKFSYAIERSRSPGYSTSNYARIHYNLPYPPLVVLYLHRVLLPTSFGDINI